MKRTYTGLSSRRIVVESQPLMQYSKQEIKGKTNQHSSPNTNWAQENITVEEFGMSDITVTDISTTP